MKPNALDHAQMAIPHSLTIHYLMSIIRFFITTSLQKLTFLKIRNVASGAVGEGHFWHQIFLLDLNYHGVAPPPFWKPYKKLNQKLENEQ